MGPRSGYIALQGLGVPSKGGSRPGAAEGYAAEGPPDNWVS